MLNSDLEQADLAKCQKVEFLASLYRFLCFVSQARTVACRPWRRSLPATNRRRCVSPPPGPTISSHSIGFYRVLLGFTGFYWVLLGFTWFYVVLLVFTVFYSVLLGFIGFY